MATKLILRPPPLSISIFSPTHILQKPSSSLFKPSTLPFFSTISSTLTLTLTLDSDFTYGPSLHKGQKKPSQPHDRFQHQSKPFLADEEPDQSIAIDKETFTRTFDIAAIRVPAERCFALESSLRGHLLNWPRVRNIARVPGDEMESDFKKIMRENCHDGDEDERFDSVSRRVYGKAEGDGEVLSPVLYREKLMKTFNCRGFVKFRNLAKMSRPKKKKGNEGEGFEGRERMRKRDFVAVEVVGENGDDDEDFSGLLGDDFNGGRWRGSTRLLLLDERYAGISVKKLPEAVKALLTDDIRQSRTSIHELVQCKLTLFYNYWQMNEILEALLPKGMIVPTAFETVGHIAHLNLREEHRPYKKLIAQVVLDKNKPKIETVVNKIDSIQNDYRTMQLEVLAGNHSLVTTVVENGIRFHVDLARVYWNSRLATERQRLISNFTSNDVVCDVFSGVGPIAISAAKKVKHVYANDLNPSAVDYMERNIVLNKLERKIEVYNMDGRRFINAIFANQRAESITQVVMNLPNDAAEYLGTCYGKL